MNHSEKTSELMKALLEAESNFETIEKNNKARAGSGEFKYADLTTVFNATKKQLREHGLKCVGYFSQDEQGVNILTMQLFHVSGEWIKSTLKFTPVSNKPSDLGSIITYMRRYLYITLLGISTDEDVEGNDLNEEVELVNEPAKSPAKSKEGEEGLTPAAIDNIQKKVLPNEALVKTWREKFKVWDLTKINRAQYLEMMREINKLTLKKENENASTRVA